MAQGITYEGLYIVLDIGDDVFDREKSTCCEVVIFKQLTQRIIVWHYLFTIF
jgi:hypothetical protein